MECCQCLRGHPLQLIQQLREIGPMLVVMEATGGFEVPAAAALAAAEVPVVIANHFASGPRLRQVYAASSPRPMRSTPFILALFAERVRPQVRASA